MGKLIRFVILALLAYGLFQAGSAQVDQFKLKDAVRELTMFGADKGDDALRAAIVAEAARMGIRVVPARVIIRTAGEHTYVEVAYTRPVKILPWYEYNWPFELKAESWRLPGGRFR